MRCDFAPMEGITGYVFRNAHRASYDGVDKYFTPFLAPGSGRRLTSRERNDILPEHNRGLSLVPQVLTNRAEDFLWVCRELAEYGYREVNLNLGCPSGTVTAKGKGAAFLGQREELDRFFDQVFSELSGWREELFISVKTRVGVEAPEEFEALLDIFNRYPLCEVIIHPRIRSDFYQGAPRMASFSLGMEKSVHPVCYNGDIVRAADVRRLLGQYPGLCSVMAGRGAVASPQLFERIRALQPEREDFPDSKGEAGRLLEFHDRLLDGYGEVMSGERNVLFKMKELWFYLGCHFPDCKRELKQIKKAQRLSDYRLAVRALFEGGRYEEEACFRP